MKGKDLEANKTDEDPEPRAHYHTSLQHPMKIGQSFTQVRCGLDAGDPDCLPCYQRDNNGDKRVSGKFVYSFNCLHLTFHERIEKRDPDGKVICYERDGEHGKRGDPVLTWAEVTKSRDRDAIEDELDAALEDGKNMVLGGVVMFRKKYIEVGRGWRDQITTIEAMANEMCTCGGTLAPIRFICEKCEDELIDVEKENLDDEELLRYSEERQHCRQCGHNGLPLPDPECDSCDAPVPLSAMDVVAWIRRVGEGSGSHIQVEKVERLDEFLLPDQTSLIEWEQDGDEWFPKLDSDGRWIFTEEHDIQKTVTNQWNFESIHSPRDHAWIAHRLGCQVPPDFAPSKDAQGGGGSFRRYGGKGGKEEAGGRRGRVDDDVGKTPEGRRRGRAAEANSDSGNSGRRGRRGRR